MSALKKIGWTSNERTAWTRRWRFSRKYGMMTSDSNDGRPDSFAMALLRCTKLSTSSFKVCLFTAVGALVCHAIHERDGGTDERGTGAPLRNIRLNFTKEE